MQNKRTNWEPYFSLDKGFEKNAHFYFVEIARIKRGEKLSFGTLERVTGFCPLHNTRLYVPVFRQNEC